MITLDDIARIFGDNHFKLCRGKRAVDANLYNLETAKTWVSQGGTVGLWCPEGFVIIDIDDQEQASCLDKASHTLKCKTPHGMHFYYINGPKKIFLDVFPILNVASKTDLLAFLLAHNLIIK